MKAWLSIGEVREGVEAEVAATLSLHSGSLDRGRHYVVARDELHGVLAEPYLVSEDGKTMQRRELSHEAVVAIAMMAYLSLSEGVTLDATAERIFVARPLALERDVFVRSIGRVRRKNAEVLEFLESLDIVEEQCASVHLSAEIDREGEARAVAIVAISQKGQVVRRELEQRELTRLMDARAVELDRDVTPHEHIVGGGKFVSMTVGREIAWEGVRAIEDALLPGASLVDRALSIVEPMDKARSLVADRPRSVRDDDEPARAGDGRGADAQRARGRGEELDRDSDTGRDFEIER